MHLIIVTTKFQFCINLINEKKNKCDSGTKIGFQPTRDNICKTSSQNRNEMFDEMGLVVIYGANNKVEKKCNQRKKNPKERKTFQDWLVFFLFLQLIFSFP